MAVENEEMSLAVCNLLQAIIDSLSGEDKREHRGKEEALVLGRRRSSVSVPGAGGQGRVRHHLRLGIPYMWRWSGLIFILIFLKKFFSFLYFYKEGKGGRKRERSIHV